MFPVVIAQTQRKYELEADLRVKTESRLREVEEQLQNEISARVQIQGSSQHTSERILQQDRQVCQPFLYLDKGLPSTAEQVPKVRGQNNA